MQYEIQPLTENALVIKFGDSIRDDTHEKVMALFHKLQRNPFFALTDLTPAYTSLAVFYDAIQIYKIEKKSPFLVVKENLEKLLSEELELDHAATSIVEIPACFENKFAPDLPLIAQAKNLSVEEVIRLFCALTYKVYMIGFAPGFPYMGLVDERIAMPRKEIPRMRVDAGSVAIAGNQAGIYPFQTPGGWQVIGRTPFQLFDLNNPSLSLLKAGDYVKFYAVPNF